MTDSPTVLSGAEMLRLTFASVHAFYASRGIVWNPAYYWAIVEKEDPHMPVVMFRSAYCAHRTFRDWQELEPDVYALLRVEEA